MFVKLQKNAILTAIGLERQVQPNGHVDQIITSAVEVLRGELSEEKEKKKKEEEEKERLSQLKEYAYKLSEFTSQRFNEICESLNFQIKALTPSDQFTYNASITSSYSLTEESFLYPINEVAEKLKYVANPDKHSSWVLLEIDTKDKFGFFVSTHGFGHGDTGILAVSAFTVSNASVLIDSATTEVFQFNHAEPFENIKERYADWLESSLTIALAEWKNQLD